MVATIAERPGRRRRLLGRILAGVFLAGVAALLVRHARGVAWPEVAAALRDYRAGQLGLAAGLVALSYGLYGSFDLFARAAVGHRLPPARTWAIGAVSYAFNLNLGAVVGGFGMRLRLYARHGLDAGTTARLIAVGVTINWLGYLALAGVSFTIGALELPPGWRIGDTALRALGVAMMVAFAGVLLACWRSPRRTWTIRGYDLTLPTLRIALAQATVSIVNWLTIATLMYVLLGARIAFATLVAVMLLAAIAGVLSHVPAGLGVLEAVFLVLLGDRVAPHGLIAALLAYRAVYYLAPLAVAAIAWPVLEASARRYPAQGGTPARV
jgi:uncharacterized membrane protein YbhN (UPF0104 family)